MLCACISVYIYMSECVRIYNIYASKYINQGLLYHRTCKRDLLCSWPSLNSYLK